MPDFTRLMSQLAEDMDIYFNYKVDGQCQKCAKIGAVNEQYICRKCNISADESKTRGKYETR